MLWPSESFDRPAAKWVGRPAAKWVGRPAAKWVGRPAAEWVGRPAAEWVGRPGAGVGLTALVVGGSTLLATVGAGTLLWSVVVTLSTV